jgi:hypothetical protein
LIIAKEGDSRAIIVRVDPREVRGLMRTLLNGTGKYTMTLNASDGSTDRLCHGYDDAWVISNEETFFPEAIICRDPPPTPAPESKVGLAIGLTIGGIFGIALLLVLVVVVWQRRSAQRKRRRLEERLEREGMDMASLTGSDVDFYV